MSIRRVLLIGLAFAACSPLALADQFCEGFKTGYTTGYKQAANSSLKPLAPLCPLKPLKGFGDPKDDFEFGYTLGFQAGSREGSR